MTDRTSKLEFFSMGIVLTDKVKGSDNIEVYPVEELPNVNKKVSEYLVKNNVSLPDSKGVTKSTSTQGDAKISARWIPLGNSNRMTAPDVCKNETVILIRYADTDEYYWTTIFREPLIRRLETVCYAFGNLAKGLVAWTKSSSYWFEVSTHDKYIQLHTSKSDGEQHEYDVKIDTKESTVTIKDDIDNSIILDSRARSITIQQTDGSMLHIEPNKIGFTNNAGSTITFVDGVITLTATDKVLVASKLVVTKGMSITNSDGSAAVEISGNTTMNGNIQLNGTMNASGNVNAPNID